MDMRLPAGLVDVNGKLHRDFEVREMTGYDEEYLLNNIKENQETKLDTLIGFVLKMTVKLGSIEKLTDSDLKKLLIGDLTYMLVAIRQKSFGNFVSFKVNCPNCKKENEEDVDITALKVKGLEDNSPRQFDVKLDAGWKNEAGKVFKDVKIKLLSVEDQIEILKYSKTDIARSVNTMYQKSIVEFGGLPIPVNQLILKELLKRDRDKIGNEIAKQTPGIELTTEITCYECGTKFSVPIGVENFFVSKAV